MNTIKKRVEKLMYASGVEKKFKLHSIRSAVVSMLVKNGIDPLHAMWFGCWTSMAVFRMYYNRGTDLTVVSESLTQTLKTFTKEVVVQNPCPPMEDESALDKLFVNDYMESVGHSVFPDAAKSWKDSFFNRPLLVWTEAKLQALRAKWGNWLA